MTRKHIDIKCPKCNKNPDHYNEYWSGEIWQFDVNNGVVNKSGYTTPADPIYVLAVCKCGNEWRVKGISQITDII